MVSTRLSCSEGVSLGLIHDRIGVCSERLTGGLWVQSVIIRSVMVTIRGAVNSGQKNKVTDTIDGNELSLGSALQTCFSAVLADRELHTALSATLCDFHALFFIFNVHLMTLIR